MIERPPRRVFAGFHDVWLQEGVSGSDGIVGVILHLRKDA